MTPILGAVASLADVVGVTVLIRQTQRCRRINAADRELARMSLRPPDLPVVGPRATLTVLPGKRRSWLRMPFVAAGSALLALTSTTALVVMVSTRGPSATVADTPSSTTVVTAVTVQPTVTITRDHTLPALTVVRTEPSPVPSGQQAQDQSASAPTFSARPPGPGDRRHPPQTRVESASSPVSTSGTVSSPVAPVPSISVGLASLAP